jgi:hypothetical protein
MTRPRSTKQGTADSALPPRNRTRSVKYRLKALAKFERKHSARIRRRLKPPWKATRKSDAPRLRSPVEDNDASSLKKVSRGSQRNCELRSGATCHALQGPVTTGRSKRLETRIKCADLKKSKEDSLEAVPHARFRARGLRRGLAGAFLVRTAGWRCLLR